jgi:hypothetical protein
MSVLLAALWFWSVCPGEVPVAYRVEWVRRAPVGYVESLDDNGALIWLPLYNVWAPTFNSEGPEMSAEVPCEPGRGEVCVTIVTSLDEWQMEDEGESCD